MKKKVILKISGQKAISEEIEMESVISQDLARIAKKYPNTFGKADEAGSYANMLATNSLDQSASTVKLKCKDSAKLALDVTLPWSQAESEFAKLSGTPELDIVLAGVVGVAV